MLSSNAMDGNIDFMDVHPLRPNHTLQISPRSEKRRQDPCRHWVPVWI